jgi:RNA polymerase sigma-70 factor (ECF subfamily)
MVPGTDPRPPWKFAQLWQEAGLANAVIRRLRDEMVAKGDGSRFEGLEPTLAGERTGEGYEALAARFGVSEAGVKSMVVRLRQRFRELLRDEISETIRPGQDLETELKHLFEALKG